jgi:chemotaxis protein CheD
MRTNIQGGRNIEVMQGEYFVMREPGITLSTVLGSCVAVCFLDPVSGLGGMNHILLPEAPRDQVWKDPRYGDHSLELLLKTMISRGADMGNLQAKIYGGASIFSGSLSVGERNIAVAMDFLACHGIEYFGGCVGGEDARRIWFNPALSTVELKRFERRPDNDHLPSLSPSLPRFAA